MKVIVRVKHYRKKHKMSQQFIADYCCVARETVANWESGHRLPNIVIIKMLADLFNISIEQLIGCKERYYVLASSLYNEKLTDTSVLSFVLRIIKGITTVLIMIPLLISIPLKTKENEERRLYHDIVNNNVDLILQVNCGGIVEEYTFNRIDSKEIKNITNQYNISEPNHENIECGFYLKRIIYIESSHSQNFIEKEQTFLRVFARSNTKNYKCEEIKSFVGIPSIINQINLVQESFRPTIYDDINFEVIFLVANNKFYIGAFSTEV